MNVIWFRSDLRVRDNPALFKAMEDGPCIAIYCLTPKQWDIHNLSQIQRSLVVENLIQLEKQLCELNVPLQIVECGDYRQLVKGLLNFCRKNDVKKIFYNHQYEYNEKECENQVSRELKVYGIDSYSFHDQCIISPGLILNGSGDCYKVFTAFNKKWFSNLGLMARPLYKTPTRQSRQVINSSLNGLGGITANLNKPVSWVAGEIAAHEELSAFIEQGLQNYHIERDYPYLDSTSKLSTYLAIGVLTTRQCLQALHSEVAKDGRDPYQLLTDGEKTWLDELAWREFYRNITIAFPRVSKNIAFKEETDSIPWCSDPVLFSAWCEGKTGYPIIDAAMRQLNTTGWMHNRLRMVVAMFLTKHLFIDWRLGEDYFYSQLADADFSSNNGGWQWSASTGVDAAPYFRVFNPYRQAERFDPNGDFVRKYVKELSCIEGKAIHKPTNQLARDLGYPLPIIDIKLAVERVKTEFKKAQSF